jgi:predicted secreted protein
MAKVNGTSILLYIETAPGTWTPIAGSTSANISIDADLPDATTKDSGGWAESIHGLRSLSVDVDGLHDDAGTLTDDDLAQLVIDRTPVMWRMMGTSGTIFYQGEGKIGSYSKSADMEQPVGFTVSITGNKKFTQYFMPVSAATNAGGTTITLNTGISVANPAGKQAQFTFTENAAPRTFSAAAAGGAGEIVLTVDGAPIAAAATLLLTYTPGNVLGALFGELVGFTNFAVQNNVP